VFFKKIKFFFALNIFLMFLDHFDVLMLKINLNFFKNIILMYFQTKNTMKNNRYHNAKHYLKFK
jgi:hypothetical protein